MSALPSSVRRCPETRAHYAHEWYPSGLRVQCPGGPAENRESDLREAVEALADEWERDAATHFVRPHLSYLSRLATALRALLQPAPEPKP